MQDGAPGGAMKIARPSNKRPWIVKVLPMPCPPASFEPLRPAAVVRIVSVSPSSIDPISPLTAELLSLTRTESIVAGYLKKGSSDDAIALQLKVSVSTIRTHVKAILAKAEVKSKAELAHVLTLLSAGD